MELLKVVIAWESDKTKRLVLYNGMPIRNRWHSVSVGLDTGTYCFVLGWLWKPFQVEIIVMYLP